MINFMDFILLEGNLPMEHTEEIASTGSDGCKVNSNFDFLIGNFSVSTYLNELLCISVDTITDYYRFGKIRPRYSFGLK